MSKSQDRLEIVRAISDAAELYREHLVGRQFMYVFDGRYIEVIYKTENFRHLTGVDTPLSAKRFYSYAARRILAASQISFSARHPYALCVRKLKQQRIRRHAHFLQTQRPEAVFVPPFPRRACLLRRFARKHPQHVESRITGIAQAHLIQQSP